jgi:2-amino-4-hydroxy-6-hydroxymethyldihydropteridine diphosphokinase
MVIAIVTILTRAFVSEKNLIGDMDVGQLTGFFVLIGSLIIIYRNQYQGDKETEVILGVGSNINPQVNLTKGYEALAADFKIMGSSSIYQTQAVKSQPDAQDYMNQTIALRAAMALPDLYKHLKTIEKAFGREPGNKQAVPLDLDILTYGDQVFNFQGKQIPDPDLGKYRYIAEPLGEMSPNFRHPATGISIERILDKIEDEAKISKINEVDDGIKR